MTKVENDSIDRNNNKDGKKRAYALRHKIFKLQDSYMCHTLANKDMKSAYNLILALVIFFSIANAFHLYTNPDTFWNELNFVMDSFGHYELFLLQHIVYTILILTVHYSLTKLWTKLRSEFDNRIVMIDTIYTFIMISIFGIIHSVSISSIIKLKINAVMSLAISKECKKIQFITREQLLFYLYAPTLVYRDEYPRLEKRDYKMMIKMSIQYCICLYFLLIMQCRIFYPIFSRIGLEPIDSKTLANDLAKVFVASGACCILFFYGFLHLQMNICSQIFRFDDRVFYEDWWSATNSVTYLRKWNILVHDWLYAYLYTPSVHIFKGNRLISAIAVIFISSLVHEIILIAALRQVTPILSILFAGCGAVIFSYTKMTNLARFRKVKKEVKELAYNGNLSEHPKLKKDIDVKSLDFTIGNTVFLFLTFYGWFMMITIYAVGYFSVKNCLDNNSYFPTFSNKCLKIQF